MKKKTSWSGFCFVLPSLAGVTIFFLIPFLDVLRRSVTEMSHGKFTGLSNYLAVFQNQAFQLAVKNTLRFEVVCISLLICLSLLAAVLLANYVKRVRIMKSCMLVPLAIPVASMVLLWRVLFHENGMLNGILKMFHMNGVDWMHTDSAFWILVFSYIWKNLGYNVVIWTAGLLAIPYGIYEEAKMDGAGNWQCFFYITLPNLKPTLFTITVLSVLNSFKVFREAYLVAGDYPHESMYLMQHLFNNWFRDLAFDKIAAAAVVNGAVIFILVLLLKKAWNTEE